MYVDTTHQKAHEVYFFILFYGESLILITLDNYIRQYLNYFSLL